jgi:hypothetical protein
MAGMFVMAIVHVAMTMATMARLVVSVHVAGPTGRRGS